MNSNTRKFAFGFQKRTGKTTSVDYLKSKYGGVEISFAEPLYNILNYAQKICGFKEEKDRKFLQWIGTDWGREKEKSVWLRLANEKIRDNTSENMYVSDVRFKNEFHMLKKQGFKMIRLVRKQRESTNIESIEKHKSEIDLLDLPDNDWDYIIYNDGTMEELYTILDKIYKGEL